MTSASHAEGRQFDPGQVYFRMSMVALLKTARHPGRADGAHGNRCMVNANMDKQCMCMQALCKSDTEGI